MVKKIIMAVLGVACIAMLGAAYYFQTKITAGSIIEYTLSLDQRTSEIDALNVRVQELQSTLAEINGFNVEVNAKKTDLLNSFGTWKSFQADFAEIQELISGESKTVEDETAVGLEYTAETTADTHNVDNSATVILIKGTASNYDKMFSDAEQALLKSYGIQPYDVTITVKGNYITAMESIERVLEKYYFTHISSTLEIDNSYATLVTNGSGVMEIQIKLYCQN